MSDYFKSMVKELNDENTHLLSDGGNSAEFSGWIDTGSYILNALVSGSLYGGVPNNKVVALAGEQATGKTFFALGMVKNFLEQNKDGGTIYYDTEAAVTKDMMETRGIDTNRLIVAEPQTIQQFRHHGLQVLDRYIDSKESPPMMMVLDSLGQLSTTKEMEDSLDGKETRDMTKAQVIKATFRTLGLKLAKAQVPMIITNHTYDVVGAYVPTKEMSGGSGLKYTASTILFLSKKRDKDVDKGEGNLIKVTAEKSRFTKEKKQVEVRLSYTHGLDRYYGLLDLAEQYNIIKKVSTRYEFPDGSKHFGKAINSDPQKFFTDDIMDRLERAAAEEYKYGPADDYVDDFDDEELAPELLNE
jgi:RecA/RadA recombinase